MSGLLTPVGSLRANWHNHSIEAPTDFPARAVSEGGLLASIAADTVNVSPPAGERTAIATFKPGDFEQHWPGRSDVRVSVSLKAQTVDIDVTARNTGDQPEPVGMGWHPRFLIPDGHRNEAQVRLPSGDEVEPGDRVKGTPSGRLVPPAPSTARFQQHASPLGVESFDVAIAHPRPGLLDQEVYAEVRDPSSAFGLRLISKSDNTREVRVMSPAGSDFVSLGMQSNLDDPFSAAWGNGDPAISTLLPGQTAEWHVQLQIFPILKHEDTSR
jgi:galactose mutarotase-like enzyme